MYKLFSNTYASQKLTSSYFNFTIILICLIMQLFKIEETLHDILILFFNIGK